MSHKLFVYGTLKRGERNHFLMTDPSNGKAVFIGSATLVKPYPIVVHWEVPFLLPEMPQDKPPNIVQGELYEINDSMLAVLDELEEHPTVYLRTPTRCILKDSPISKGIPEDSSTSNEFLIGTPVDCEVYFFNKISEHPELYELPYMSDFKGCLKKRKESLKEAMENMPLKKS